MPYKENLIKAKSLKKELDKYRPLTTDMEKRIMQKFRLDWNYHSSHIEGNTLTYGETKALILFGQTAQAKPLKDHLEMSGHDEAIKTIEEVIKQKRPLTENFIRELHNIILNNPYEVDAITPDGKPTKKMIQIGKYKTTPNHVKTKTGEIFYFAKPEETPAKMQDLMIWYKKNLKNINTDPVLFATEFHYRFIRIHPFDDGNGRIARLLMNFILMQKGYPPAIIKSEDKQNYFAALEQADSGEIEYFFNYICQQVILSLELMIKGAKGEEIGELDDFDKRLILLKSEIEQTEIEEYGEEKNIEHIKTLVNMLVIPIFNGVYAKLSQVEQFFTKSTYYISQKRSLSKSNSKIYNETNSKILKDNHFSFIKNWYEDILKGKNISLFIHLEEMIKARPLKYDISIHLEFVFEKYYYEFKEDINKTFLKNKYSNYPSKNEIEKITSKIGNKILDDLEKEWQDAKDKKNKEN